MADTTHLGDRLAVAPEVAQAAARERDVEHQHAASQYVQAVAAGDLDVAGQCLQRMRFGHVDQAEAQTAESGNLRPSLPLDPWRVLQLAVGQALTHKPGRK